MSAERPIDENHALLVGLFVGAAMKMNAEYGNGWSVEPIDDANGWHLDTFRLEVPSGTYEVSIKKLDDPTD